MTERIRKLHDLCMEKKITAEKLEKELLYREEGECIFWSLGFFSDEELQEYCSLIGNAEVQDKWENDGIRLTTEKYWDDDPDIIRVHVVEKGWHAEAKIQRSDMARLAKTGTGFPQTCIQGDRNMRIVAAKDGRAMITIEMPNGRCVSGKVDASKLDGFLSEWRRFAGLQTAA